MSLEFNDRGKYFTDIVSKIAVSATVQTVTHRIEGQIHVRLGERVKDELDRSDFFLPMTQAKVFDGNGTLLYSAEFLTVSRAQIIWVIPSEEDEQSQR